MDGLSKVSDGLQNVSDGLGQVSNGLRKVSDGLGKVLDGPGKYRILMSDRVSKELGAEGWPGRHCTSL